MTGGHDPGVETGLGYREVLVDDLDRLPAETRFVDVREPDEFVGELGHLERAELHPLAGVLDAAENWDRTGPLLMICRSGARSSRAALALTGLGFTTIYNLRGGMLAVAAKSAHAPPQP